ncbi:MAG: NAD(P)-binding protein, partial [Saprospiraceae bacterium]|nr:NAD(P)-binding protein [Saprospiraceae bacterium]
MSRVVILGGGIAGMSAAHELIERGFRVDVYDAQEAVGKIPFPEKDTPDSVQFPSSQAFQVFAGFSRHTFDVMRRTPIGHGRSVADNLLLAQRLYVTKNGSIPLAALKRFPSSRAALRRIIRSVYSTDPPLKEKDLTVFSDNLWQLFTSCKERRKDIYERIRWAQFMAPLSQTEERAVDCYQTYLIRGLARLFVHAPPEQMSAKMGGDLILHLLLSMRWPECKGERILNGTLNDAWLAPWYKYLEEKGVQFHAGSEVVHLHCDAASKKITHATLRESQSGKTQKLEADFFICAVPVTEMSTLINPEMVRVDETLADIQQLAAYRPLNEGIQYYLRQAAAIPDKHIICLHTPWELSVTAPHQFWPEAKWVSYGNGNIRGMLAVTISAWDTPGFNGKSASECSFPEVVEEVWDQLERTFNTTGPVLSKEMR